MFFRLTRAASLLILLAFLPAAVTRSHGAPTGPTLQLDYGGHSQQFNPLSSFIYFIPLISFEPVSVLTNVGNTQSARITSFHCSTNGATFHADCEFDFTGAGLLENVFDHTELIKRCDQQLKAGKPLLRQLGAINVQGSGSGAVEVDGTMTNGQLVVTEVRLRFNSRGRVSPVSVILQDLCWRDGKLSVENQTVARVNQLAFHRNTTAPKMEVTLASVKRTDAGDSLWQNFVGGLKGVAANLLLPPLSITANGHQAMMDFGLALATQKETFTFPFATRLKEAAAR